VQRLLLDAKIIVGYVLGSSVATLGVLCNRKGDYVMGEKNAVCVLIAYDEDGQKITTCTVDRAAVLPMMNDALVMDWPLHDIGFKLDDEFARLIGGVAFKLLATRQQRLSPLITVTEDPESKGGPPSA
jgi:hypothetical protein